MSRITTTRQPLPKKQLNPLWRGIGCIMLVGFVLGGYFFAGWFLKANAQNGWVFIPGELSGPGWIALPAALKLGAGIDLSWMYVKLAVTFFFAIAGLTISTVVYGIINPLKPGEFDVPLERRRR